MSFDPGGGPFSDLEFDGVSHFGARTLTLHCVGTVGLFTFSVGSCIVEFPILAARSEECDVLPPLPKISAFEDCVAVSVRVAVVIVVDDVLTLRRYLL